MRKNILSFLKKYFTFRRNNRLGFFALFTIIILLLFIDLSISKLKEKHKKYDFSKFSTQIDSFENSLKPIKKEYISRLDKYIIARYDTLNLFKFNPNTASDKQWKELGLTQKQINTINNYKSRGGRFLIKDDLRKIYGIRTRQYQILEPYIDLPKEIETRKGETNRKTLFAFDPNIASKEDLEKLGFSHRQVSNIINYRNKGGKFSKAEDLKKIYSISEKDYAQYSSFIEIKNPITTSKNNTIIPQNIELNSADTSQLKTLPGIGSVIAKRIIKYRDRLGGFYSSEQLKEVYGLKTETYNKIKKYLSIDIRKIKKININFAEYKQIISHPYIDKAITLKIVRYREKNGFYSSLNQLITNNILTKAEYQKLKNYLTTE